MKKKNPSFFSTTPIDGVVLKTFFKKILIVLSSGQEVFVSTKNSFFSLPGDHVSVILSSKKKSRPSTNRVFSVTKRVKNCFVGSIDSFSGNIFFVPDGNSIYFDVFIAKAKPLFSLKNKKVVVEVFDWGEASSKKSPVGRVVSVLGDLGDPKIEVSSIAFDYGFSPSFPKGVSSESANFSSVVSRSEIKRRVDYRGVPTFTIDPSDAKDFDDAISVFPVSEKIWEIGVHIADVSYYVSPGSAIDLEAKKRGTSVYLSDRVVPMLPEILSNDLCSLRPNIDRFCFSVLFSVSSSYEILDYSIEKTVIHSNKRFSYKEAQDCLDSEKGNFYSELSLLNSIAKSLRSSRKKEGSIFFERPEVSFVYSKKNTPLDIVFKPVLASNLLVEEFMLLANKTIASHVSKKTGASFPFLYRVHDLPDSEKLSSLKSVLSYFDIPFSFSKKPLSISLNNLLSLIKTHPQKKLLETLILRSMSKAVYSPNNIGHFGLAFPFYTHFTSPIRRYSDLLVHRLVFSFLSNSSNLERSVLKGLCFHLSEQEQRATKAERDSIKYMKALFLGSKIGVVFDGVISGVTDWGFYVELLENNCEGLVSVSSLKNDSFFLDKKTFSLVGARTKTSYQLGQPVVVRVVSVNFEKKQVDFNLV